ncbi:MAG: hypothetical protein JJ855_19325 [Rhodospirillales bacterium]|nr:hypothetical protein [Rhodospirillales bacterium]
MIDNDETSAEEKNVPGPGGTAWLAAVIGAPRQSQANAAPPLPLGFGPKSQARRVEILLPEEVVVAEGGNLQRIEIRGLPIGVRLTAGTAMKEGFWQLEPADLYGVAAMIPDGIDLPFSVMLKGVFVGDDPETPWTELTGYEFTDAGATEMLMERISEPVVESSDSEPVTEWAPEPDPLPDPEPEPISAPERHPEPVARETPVPEPDETHVPETTDQPEHEALSEPGHEPEAVLSPMMVVIDLDVSVGTEDPNVLKDIMLHFSGLPEGAILTAGDLKDGVWSVPASALSALAVVIPEQTPDFDLDIEMEIAGAPPQSATIQVENPNQPVDPASAFCVNLTGGGTGQTRISIYTDGVATYDRVVNWTEAATTDLSLLVPYAESGLPFEILMRYESLDKGAPPPVLKSIDIDGTKISPRSPAITANGTVNEDGLSWSGDLVVDVRAAMKQRFPEPERNSVSSPEPEGEAGMLAHTPSEMSEPSAALDPGTETFQSITQTERVLTPQPEPTQEAEEFPLDDVVDAGTEDTDDLMVEAGADTTDKQANDEAETSGVLVVDATFNDLQRPAFINELRNLRDFIRTRPADHNGEIYGRLGIEVTKWHDMSVRGPSGAEVELEPRLPHIAPKGGIDNTRDLIPVELGGLAGVTGVEVRVNGIPPGALLTRGRNLGKGVWQLAARDCTNVAMLPPIGRAGVTTLHVGWLENGKKESSFPLRKSVIVGQSYKRPPQSGIDMPSMSLRLDAETFDPGGHGSLSLTIGEMPPGSILSKGKNHGGGVWTLEAKTGESIALAAVRAMAPFDITLTCVALNPETGNSTVVSRVLESFPGQGKLRVRSEAAA